MPLRQPHPGTLTAAEVDAFRSVVRRPRDRAAVSLMLDAGLRASEVVGLTLDGIDWKDQVLRFTGKGGRAAEIPISARLRDALERAIQTRPATADHPYFMYDLRNPAKSVSRFALLKMVKRHAKKAGIEKRVFCHLLRHTFGTNVFRETGDLGRTQVAMRHTKIQTTTIYMHLTPEDQRDTFEGIDTRPWLFRWWSRMKPAMIPDALRPRQAPLIIGETIGRGDEIAQLRQCLRQRMHVVLVGDRGVGRRHLLHQAAGEIAERGVRVDSSLRERIEPYGVEDCEEQNASGQELSNPNMTVLHIEAFSPARECLVELCRTLVKLGHIHVMPEGRSDKAFLEALRKLGRDRPIALIIDALNDITKKERQNLHKLAEVWTIATSIDRREAGKLGLIFFGHYKRIEVEPFDKTTAVLFTRQMLGHVRVPDEKAYLNHVFAQSGGNPQAIIELVEATRKTGETAPTHAAVQRVLPAVVFMAMFAMAGFMARSSATALSEPVLRLYAICFVVLVLILMTFDKALTMKAR